jgi:hypothetical protein
MLGRLESDGSEVSRAERGPIFGGLDWLYGPGRDAPVVTFSTKARVVGTVLSKMANRHASGRSVAFPSVQRLASKTGLSQPSIKRALRELCGEISVEEWQKSRREGGFGQKGNPPPPMFERRRRPGVTRMRGKPPREHRNDEYFLVEKLDAPTAGGHAEELVDDPNVRAAARRFVERNGLRLEQAMILAQHEAGK